MIEFFQDGGWGMWAILFVGLLLLGAAGRYAHRPEPRRLGFIAMLAVSELLSMFYTTLTDLGTVFHALSREDKFPDNMIVRVLFEGLKECTRPGVFGGVILTVASLLVAGGMARAATAEKA